MNPNGHEASAPSVETPLRAELAQADRAVAAMPAVLAHLVANAPEAVFSEEIIARTRGQVESLAQALSRTTNGPAAPDRARELAGELVRQPTVLSFCHAMALESQLAERLSREAGIDPVRSPLIQACIASGNADLSTAGMKLLTSEARFRQAQRRMELLAQDLPADLLAEVLRISAGLGGADADAALDRLRNDYDEARGRHALLARVALALEPSMNAGLSLDEAGLALFLTTLALATGIDRTTVILATTEGQQIRLGLMLSIAGLSAAQVEATMARLHPDAPLRPELATVSPGDAALILSGNRS